MGFFGEFLSFAQWIRELFSAYRKVKDEEWFQDSAALLKKLNSAQTTEDKKSASRDLARLLGSL